MFSRVTAMPFTVQRSVIILLLGTAANTSLEPPATLACRPADRASSVPSAAALSVPPSPFTA